MLRSRGNRKKMGLKIFLYGFLALGIVFCIVSAIVTVSFQKKKDYCTQIVEARIVTVNQIERSEAGNDPPYRSYFPVYEYKYMGKTYQKASNVGNRKQAFEIGKTVQIYINPDNPEMIYEDSAVPKLVSIIFGIIGVLFVVIAVLLKLFVFNRIK